MLTNVKFKVWKLYLHWWIFKDSLIWLGFYAQNWNEQKTTLKSAESSIIKLDQWKSMNIATYQQTIKYKIYYFTIYKSHKKFYQVSRHCPPEHLLKNKNPKKVFHLIYMKFLHKNVKNGYSINYIRLFRFKPLKLDTKI